ncbi:MAG TPA: metal-binding protein [Rhodospirillaceae bacterium]|nr:metal-binding protein [Rhodospirillaceae bacterium]
MDGDKRPSAKAPAYDDPGCAYCPTTVQACRQGESETRGPGFCPSKVCPDTIRDAVGHYQDPTILKVAQVSARIEAEGYCQWTRVEEIVQFARQMGFTKVGIASCISFLEQAKTLSAVLESHGFEVASTACKHGSVAKENIGLRDDEKIRPGQHESMCNPVSQAQVLNAAGCEFNIVLGLCVGHDSLFFKYSDGLATTLVAKDRVLAHNPIGALNLADSYYSRIWGPGRPDKMPNKPKRKSKEAAE